MNDPYSNLKSGPQFSEKESENPELLTLLDSYFVVKRGHIVTMPKPGEAVVACMSGGLDSTANIAMLLEQYGLVVYPFFINRGQSCYQYEKEAVTHYDSYFSQRYPDQYHPVCEIEITTPPAAYKERLKASLTSNNISYPARNSVIFLIGAEYGYSLRSEGVTIHTLFASHVSSDGSFHCSQTWTRLTNMTICHIMNDYQWQFISLPIETAFGNYYDKDVYIRFCQEHNIPLDMTRTCVKENETACGDCPPCWERRRVYRDLGVDDTKQYLKPMAKTIPTSYN